MSTKDIILLEPSHTDVFPSGIRELDMNILLFLPNSSLALVSCVCKYLALICDDNEFWRLKLNKLLDYEFPKKNNWYKFTYKITRKNRCWKVIEDAGADVIRLVKNLVSKGYAVHTCKDSLTLSLRNIAEVGNIQAVKDLVDLCKSVNVECDYNPALWFAARWGHLDIVKYLVDLGATDQRAVSMASYCGHIPVINYLVHKGFDIRADDEYALRNALQSGNLEVVKYLINLGANIHIKYKGERVISIAAQRGYLHLVKYLVDLGLDPHADDDAAVRSASCCGRLEVVKYLVDLGANIRAKDDYALWLSAREGHLEVVNYLVDLGANIHAGNDRALNHAVQKGHFPVVKYLVEKGSKIHIEDDLAITCATKNGHLLIVNYLKEKGF